VSEGGSERHLCYAASEFTFHAGVGHPRLCATHATHLPPAGTLNLEELAHMYACLGMCGKVSEHRQGVLSEVMMMMMMWAPGAAAAATHSRWCVLISLLHVAALQCVSCRIALVVSCMQQYTAFLFFRHPAPVSLVY
jgi:hypothetical protein